MKNNYLYLIKLTAWIKSDSNKNQFNFLRSSDGFFNTLNEAIEYGKLYLHNNVFYELAETENDIFNIIKLFENDKQYGYNF